MEKFYLADQKAEWKENILSNLILPFSFANAKSGNDLKTTNVSQAQVKSR